MFRFLEICRAGSEEDDTAFVQDDYLVGNFSHQFEIVGDDAQR